MDKGEKIVKGYHIFLDKILGEGAHATVYMGKNGKTDEQCAIKCLDRDKIDGDEYSKRAMKSEINLMKVVDSPNIVKLFDVIESTRNYYIVQQLCEDTLLNKLEKEKKFNEEKVKKILEDISLGMLGLIREGIVHRDLKPANILYADNAYKIGDFGIATRNNYSNVRNSSIVGTPLYMAPEILKGEKYTNKCDIWSLGIIFYELLHGHIPWMAQTEHALVKQILTVPIKYDKQVSQQMKSFISGCLCPDENSRFNWQAFFSHPIHNNKFIGYVKSKKFNEWKMNKFMADLRFMINKKNISLDRMFKVMGIKFEHDLSKQEFSKLIEEISDKQRPEDMNYFFAKCDLNGDGKVSRDEFEKTMEKFNIPVKTNTKNILPPKMKENKVQIFQEVLGLSEELSKKVESSFEKMYNLLKSKNTTLSKFFKKFNSKLNKEELFKVFKALDGSFAKEDTDQLFKIIDIDCSGEIDLHQFKSYYERVLGLTACME